LAPYPGFPAAQHAQGTYYESLARAIVYQQLAGAAAATIHGRVCALSGSRRFPSAARFLAIEDRALRSAGLSAGKLAALRDLAARCADGRLRLAPLARKSDEEIVTALTEVRGIGVWTAQMFLLFRLGRLDVLASGDLGVQEGLRLLDGRAERPGAREVEARGERWRPLASVACWALWRLVDRERERARRAPAPR
jgi:3-methyladenine DNA glycosylase/8-oxoguanine DNA glycosylase